MPRIQKAPAKSSHAKAHATAKETDRLIHRIEKSLEVAQADLAKLGGSLGTGVGDLRRNLARLLRDARRDATKMSKATRKDLERLQTDMRAATKPKAKGAAAKPRAGSKRKGTAKPRSAAKSATKRTASAKPRSAGKRTAAAKPRSAGTRSRSASAGR